MLKHMLIAIVAVFAFAQTASAETPTPPVAPPPVETPAPVAPPAPAGTVTPPLRREEAEGTAAPQRPSLADRVRAFTHANAGTAALTAQLATLTRERDEARTQLAALTTERDKLRKELGDVETALTGQKAIVTATAAEIAGSVGIPLDRLPAPQASSGGNAYERWCEAKGSAKNAIFREHKAEIRAEANRLGIAI